jgi:AcrR family transcriptional regulator
VAAAWAAVREAGLAGLSIRDLARRAGISTPTIYAYFDSKHDIYDAMFMEAAEEFERYVSQPLAPREPRDLLGEAARRFMDFCTSDVPRYQLLFQRTIPDFEPSPESYAPAVRALNLARQHLQSAGYDDQRSLDLWTALATGLVDQQISNDPGGTRWSSLIEEAVGMYTSRPRHEPPRRRTRR